MMTIHGMGAVTAYGRGLDVLARGVASGVPCPAAELRAPGEMSAHPARLVPGGSLEDVARLPRLRRTGRISQMAVAAGLDAMRECGWEPGASAGDTAIVFACSTGMVEFTRLFYDDIVRSGAEAARPLLFPETVYNAPASHLAAALEVTGASYALVGDSTAGLSALMFAADLLEAGTAGRVLVVAAEEADWLVPEAYGRFGLSVPDVVFGEGAAAVVVSGHKVSGGVGVPWQHRGLSFFDGAGAAQAAREVAHEARHAAGGAEAIYDSANGSWLDGVEGPVLDGVFPGVRRVAVRRMAGEAPGMAGLLQVVTAALAVRRGEVRRALVMAAGFHQVGAAAVAGGS